jgi:hypothetical protein
LTEVVASGIVTDETGSANGAINLSVSGGSGSYTFDWSNGAQTEDLTGISAGNYSVEITDVNGCVLNLSFTVGGTINGIDENKFEMSRMIFPNPFTESVQIKNIDAIFQRFILRDAIGRVCTNGSLINGNNHLDFSTFESGIYILEIENEKGERQSCLLIKQ